MIVINYQSKEVSLSSAIAAAKQLIMHRPAGTAARIHQHAKTNVITVDLMVDENGAIEETVTAQHLTRNDVLE